MDLVQHYGIRILYTIQLENRLKMNKEISPTKCIDIRRKQYAAITTIGIERKRDTYKAKFSDKLKSMIREKKILNG